MRSIAIDGPAGAGKSTIARELARELGYIYVDTGALYRAIGLYVMNKGGNVNDEASVAGLLTGLHVELRFVDTEQRVFLNGEDITGKIRSEAVSMAASAVSALPPVRAFLLQLQRDLAKTNSVVMDGRDIGTVIMPDAEIKVFMTATPEERARRRLKELIEKGENVTFDEVLADMIQRDKNDSERAAAPLKPADDAVMFINDGYDAEGSADYIIDLIRKKTNTQ